MGGHLLGFAEFEIRCQKIQMTSGFVKKKMIVVFKFSLLASSGAWPAPAFP
jgi:hypothetical protein